jgi:RNA polymerase sigma factor (sigma-70 family)
MAEFWDSNHDALRQLGAAMSAPDLRAWFAAEVLPLEATLMQFLQHNWRDRSEIPDLRQEVYLRVYEAARREIPVPARPFVLTIARNLIIDRLRKENVIAIDAVSDLETLNLTRDEPGPDRNAIARDELRRLQAALDQLPPRCREVVVLRRVEGLSRRAVAERLGITEDTVAEHLSNGMRALANLLHGEPQELRRSK